MASDVDICNLALAHLGDIANVASINPPSGNIQAQHCARFYPIARDTLLEMHSWGFATVRALLAPATPVAAWTYAYQGPAGVINYLEVLDPAATAEYSYGVPQIGDYSLAAPGSIPAPSLGAYTPYEYEVEADANGNDIILTNCGPSALLRYTISVSDATKFTPLFTLALSHHLAAMLAGPLLKGDAGSAEAAKQMQMAMGLVQQARVSDANQRNVKPAIGAAWMVRR